MHCDLEVVMQLPYGLDLAASGYLIIFSDSSSFDTRRMQRFGGKAKATVLPLGASVTHHTLT